VFDLARFLGILLALLAQSPQGSQPSSPTQQPPRFRGGTNLVRVDAFATKNGVPVQNLKADDFEISEDGTPQKIDTFEHILIEPTPTGARVDPSSVSQAIQLAGDPHRRVFVIYLDIEHVDVVASHHMKEPLIEFMNRVMSDDDLVGIMTPEMGPQQITFGRKTDVIERGLRTNWTWGRRDDIMLDDREKLYDECFPRKPGVETGNMSPVAREMALRRREKMVLDSLADLTRYMEAIRDGRTAVVTVSGGWVLFKPDPAMLIPRKNGDGSNQDPMPGTPPPVGVGKGGTLMPRPENGNSTSTPDRTECDKDRYELANLDDASYFRNILGEANRANVSFYTIDPRGLAATDAFVLPPAPVAGRRDTTPLINEDLASLKTRHDSLATLANTTNGIFLIDSNDLPTQLRRIADDLTSYYLIGYYSTNPKLDGRYRTITVRSKQPGVEIRARQGYRAASAADVNAARAAADLPVAAEKAAIARALGTIETDAHAQGRTLVRGPGEPALFHRGPSTGNQLQPAAARIFPRSDRVHLELEVPPVSSTWMGALLDRSGTKTAVPVTVGERTDSGSGQRWLTADVTLAPLGAGDYVIELITTAETEQRRTLVAFRVTQ
jgi:VWFA-related protein